jgi:hypothetical protein
MDYLALETLVTMAQQAQPCKLQMLVDPDLRLSEACFLHPRVGWLTTIIIVLPS